MFRTFAATALPLGWGPAVARRIVGSTEPTPVDRGLANAFRATIFADGLDTGDSSARSTTTA